MWVDDIITSRMQGEKNRRRLKQPDAVIQDSNEQHYIFEAERTQKGKERLELMMQLMLERLAASEYQGAFVYTPRPAIKRHFEELKKQPYLRRFVSTPSGFVPIDGDYFEVNPTLANTISVRLLPIPERL